MIARPVDVMAAKLQERDNGDAKHGVATEFVPERAVWSRDEGRCAFEGLVRRCEERSFLEYHHLTPWVVGGAPSTVNIALRCRAHNAYESEVYFAPMRAAMAERVDSFRNESHVPERETG